MSITLLTDAAAPPILPLGPYRRADYDRQPEWPRCELVLGWLYVTPSPMPWHQMATMLLVQDFMRIAKSAGGVAFAAPLDVLLADHSVVQPDVLYISPLRMGVLRDRIRGAPDLVVEVLSPGTAGRDRVRKLHLYANSDVREYWIVDVTVRHIDFLVNRDGFFAAAQPVGGRYRSAVLPEVRLDLHRFWRRFESSLPPAALP